MTEIDRDRDKRLQILERLRGQIKEGVRLKSVEEIGHRPDAVFSFLRVAPDDEESDTSKTDTDRIKSRLTELRRRRKKRRVPGVASVIEEDDKPKPGQENTSVENVVKITDLIRELPRIRQNIGIWLGSMEGGYEPGNTSLEELENLRSEVVYRISALQLFLDAGRRELDELDFHIRANKHRNSPAVDVLSLTTPNSP